MPRPKTPPVERNGTDRAAQLERLRQADRFDLIVVGGGATGLGVASHQHHPLRMRPVRQWRTQCCAGGHA